MSHFFGRRFASGSGGDGYTDHGMLTGLGDDDHPQYLISSGLRLVDEPASGIQKIGTGSGDIFSLINAGSGAALYIRQDADTTDADAAVDIVNSGNVGRALSVSSDSDSPSLPLVQFSALSTAFGQPVLSVTHADPHGLAISISGDGYLSGILSGPDAITFSPMEANPISLGASGIYVNDLTGKFYFVNSSGDEKTFCDTCGSTTHISAGCGVSVSSVSDEYLVSVDVPSLAGTGLGVEVGLDGCEKLRVLIDENPATIHIRKFGSDAENYPTNTIYDLDGYEYPPNNDRILLFLNGVTQFAPMDFTERTTSTIELDESCDMEDVLDIIILPQALGAAIGSAGTTDLQRAYNNSESGMKDIEVGDGQINIIQPQSFGSALKLSSNYSVTPVLVVDQFGPGEALRLKSTENGVASVLVQKDTVNRNTIQNSIIVERTTSSILGGQVGIGSSIMTRLENSGTGLFTASRLITAAEDASDSSENAYFAIELIDDGVVKERLRVTSVGNFGINEPNPSVALHVNGDGYFSAGLEVSHQVKVHNTPNAPLNVPILKADPAVLSNGDVWISNISGTKKINARIDDSTYSVEIVV